MPDTIETAQHFIFITQVHFCCMYSVVVWDWIVSMPREWRFIWKTSWTAVKLSYLFCRYWVIVVMPFVLFAFVTDHSKPACEKIFKVAVGLAMWNQAGAEVVLLIRTFAFFNRNMYLLTVLCCALAGVFAYQLYVIIAQMDLLAFVKPPFDQGPCLPMSKPHSAHLLGFFLAPLAFDTSVTVMTLWKAFKMRRRVGIQSSPLIQTFLREGVFYYLLISIANLINGIFYLQPRQVISAINIPLSVMFADILACRLILDLRERGQASTLHSMPSPARNPGGMKILGDTSSTLCHPPSWKPPATSHLPPFHRSSRKSLSTKSKSLTGINRRGVGATTSVDSNKRDYEGQSQIGESHNGSVELQNFPPMLPEGDVKTEDNPDFEGVDFGVTSAPTYHVVDMAFQDGQPALLRGIRIDVERTQM